MWDFFKLLNGCNRGGEATAWKSPPLMANSSAREPCLLDRLSCACTLWHGLGRYLEVKFQFWGVVIISACLREFPPYTYRENCSSQPTQYCLRHIKLYCDLIGIYVQKHLQFQALQALTLLAHYSPDQITLAMCASNIEHRYLNYTLMPMEISDFA